MTTFTQLHSPSFIALLTAGLDGFADVVTGPGVGGGPQVRVFSPRRSFFLDDFFLPHMPGSTPGALVGNIAPDPFFSGDFFPAIIPETAGLVRRDSPGTSFDRSISTGSHVLISAAASAACPLEPTFIRGPAPAVPSLSTVSTGGNITLAISTASDGWYDLETSTDLRNWTRLESFKGTGADRLIDVTPAPGVMRKFYRAQVYQTSLP